MVANNIFLAGRGGKTSAQLSAEGVMFPLVGLHVTGSSVIEWSPIVAIAHRKSILATFTRPFGLFTKASSWISFDLAKPTLLPPGEVFFMRGVAIGGSGTGGTQIP